MRTYFAFFILITAAELVFSIIYFFIQKKFDTVLLIGAIIYAIAMIAGLIAWKISSYNKKRKALLDSLNY